MKLIRAAQAGRNYLEIYGHRLRVFRMDIGPGAEGRFDENEIRRILAQLRDAR